MAFQFHRFASQPARRAKRSSRTWLQTGLAALLLAAAGAGHNAAPSPRAEAAPRDVPDEPAHTALKRFEKHFLHSRSARAIKSAHRAVDTIEEQIGAQMAEYSPGSEQELLYLKSLRTLAAKFASAHAPARLEFRLKRKSSKRSSAQAPQFPEPRELAYGFGTRDLRALDARLARALRSKVTIDAHQLLPSNRLEALLHGCIPETELALAAIQSELDVDTRCDRFARFLESWRNTGKSGEESFYQALDRTAGTEEALFFFDAMLGDFTHRFDVEPARHSLAAAHDCLHRGFLCYRQYRALIEAVSYALVLPPDIPLPERLARYDYGEPGPMSTDGTFYLRHEVDILLESFHGDVAGVITFVRKVLQSHPIPAEFWSGEPYSPVQSFNRAFSARSEPGWAQPLLEAHAKGASQRAARIRDLASAALARLLA